MTDRVAYYYVRLATHSCSGSCSSLKLASGAEALAGEAAVGGLAHGGAIDILAAVDEREERAERARLHFIGHGITADGHADERLGALRDLANELHLAFMAGVAERRFAAHVGAFVFEEEREMQ